MVIQSKIYIKNVCQGSRRQGQRRGNKTLVAKKLLIKLILCHFMSKFRLCITYIQFLNKNK